MLAQCSHYIAVTVIIQQFSHPTPKTGIAGIINRTKDTGSPKEPYLVVSDLAVENIWQAAYNRNFTEPDADMDDTDLPLKDSLNLQTARISWPELERFFARGRVLDVSAELDLLTVACALVEDDTTKFTAWTESKQVQHLQDDTAKQWTKDDSKLWAVVVAPWVVVQNRR